MHNSSTHDSDDDGSQLFQKHPTIATHTHHKPRTNKNKTNPSHVMLKIKLFTKHLLQLKKQQK
jgi:hypothetical protein